MTGEIFLRDGISEEDGESLRTWLVGLGLAAQVRRIPPKRGLESLTWIVLIALPLQGLFKAIGTKAGEDVWAGVKWMGKALSRRKTKGDVPENRPLVLQDAVSGLQIILEADLPDEAFTQLAG